MLLTSLLKTYVDFPSTIETTFCKREIAGILILKISPFART